MSPSRLLSSLLILCVSQIQLENSSCYAADPQGNTAQAARRILSSRCFACHGPDPEQRQGGFRLDVQSSFLSEGDSGEPVVTPGDPESSELLRRILTDDEFERMPPEDFGGALSADEQSVIAKWIAQGAQLPPHWSFVVPTRPALPNWTALENHLQQLRSPKVARVDAGWRNHPIDRFVLGRQLERGLRPSEESSRAELLRRLSLDLTGLPPTPEQVDGFQNDARSDAYVRQVDRLLSSPAYGEHWARKWLDLARYADSAGYADDPPRTVWAYRDWVIRALNDNMSVADFTVKQIAGDLVPNSTQDDLIATAFHRNTMTNSEGGTNDEEFRNAAIVDRVNTTMAVWMGVTMSCAQCHTHKYDPLTQEEYFKLFAIFNQSSDADRRDEKPLLELFTDEQLSRKRQWQQRVEQLQHDLTTPTATVRAEMKQWERTLSEPTWIALPPRSFEANSKSEFAFSEHGVVRVKPSTDNLNKDSYTLELEIPPQLSSLHAVEIRTVLDKELGGTAGLNSNGNFVLTNVTAVVIPGPSDKQPFTADIPNSSSELSSGKAVQAKYVRIELSGKSQILSLAEVEVFSQGANVARKGKATQKSTDYGGDAEFAIDGSTDGQFTNNSVTHTKSGADPWWELELPSTTPIEKVVVWNRTDGKLQSRLDGAVVRVLDAQRNPLASTTIPKGPTTSEEIVFEQSRPVAFRSAHADYAQSGFEAAYSIDGENSTGWAVGGRVKEGHALTLVLEKPMRDITGQRLRIRLDQQSGYRNHRLGSFQLRASGDGSVSDWAILSPEMRELHSVPLAKRDAQSQQEFEVLFSKRLAKATEEIRQELQQLSKKLTSLKPGTSVPVMKEVDDADKRETFIQIRGNYKSLGDKVVPGVPEVFHSVASERPGRMELAKWLVDDRNPLTARVWVNRVWESLFGLGIVRSSEEFGAQGDRPTHPELLDWLAVEFMESGWDSKALLRTIVLSETYRQTSRVSQADFEADKDNVWLARGPRVRLSAEMVRDQALAVSGLLARDMYGSPTRPPQPNMGLKAAFGGATDWKTSEGEDRYRRGVYTTWRRSNPYPSMATFDAPSREVCVLRRDSTNTPLQALVTLNDPGFVEAAQALARRVVGEAVDDDAKLRVAFQLASSRAAAKEEIAALRSLLEASREQLREDPSAAETLATDPLGPLPAGADAAELAAWTTVCNVLLNLDEVLMKR